MAPKVKISKEDIISAALEIIKSRGSEALSARDIAAKLGCSTQPIFSNFSSMEDLERQVINEAYEIYLGRLKKEAENESCPKYKSFGMAYIRFAKEEKELFKLLFMRDRTGEAVSESSDFEESVKYIVESTNLSREKAILLHLETWAAVHGIATMLATSFLPLEWELISDILSDVYVGLKNRHTEEEK